MLEKYKHFQNLGTPQFFIELLRLFESGSGWNREDVSAHFRNRMIGSYTLFEGGVRFATELGFISLIDGRYFKSVSLGEIKMETVESIRILLLREMTSNPALRNDVTNIFRPECISFDASERCFIISNDAFGFEYANFKHLLLDFGFLLPCTAHKFKYRIETDFKDIFTESKIFEESRRKLGIEELKKRMETNEKNGLMAECFVVEYETRRLYGIKVPIRISDVDVGAGFDIMSYENSSSEDFDRFIEVKSYVDRTGFYWSKNEVERARSLRSRYFLYLVDRNELNTTDYAPVIISNPYENLLENNQSWIVSPDGFHIFQSQ